MRARIFGGLLALGLVAGWALLAPRSGRESRHDGAASAPVGASRSPEGGAPRLVGAPEAPPSPAGAGTVPGAPAASDDVERICRHDAIAEMLLEGTSTEIRWAEAVLAALPAGDRSRVETLLDASRVPDDVPAASRTLDRPLEVRIRLAWLGERFLAEEVGIDLRGLGDDSGPGLGPAIRSRHAYLDGDEVTRLEQSFSRDAGSPCVHDDRRVTSAEMRFHTAILDERPPPSGAACGTRPGFVLHVRPVVSPDQRFVTLEFFGRGATTAGAPPDDARPCPCTLLRLERGLVVLPLAQDVALLVQPRDVFWREGPLPGPADAFPMLLIQVRRP